MAYQVTARKWRPQKFDEIVFQDHIATTIRNGIKQGRISHAYLFAGPRGVGKTTTARIVARALNCAEGPTENPCGVCEHCREIRDGSSFDVIEIDGASNRGIENIRELRENVNFAPVKARYKVYIIDEVHMLTKEAFNALLKTLEEPPPHVVFIFATTEIHQVPETILSRCQKYFFKKIPPDAIAAHLGAIAEREGFDIDGAALYPIARAADGSMRDAQSLLDQVLAFSDGRIRAESALAILGVVPVESYLSLLGHVASSDPAAVIAEIDRVASMGADLPRYVAGFIDMVRTVRLMKNGIDMKDISGFSDAEAASIRECAGLFVDSELSAFFKIAAELQGKLRIASNERVYIEMAMLDMIAVRNAPSIASIISRLEGEGAEQAAPRRKALPAADVKEKKNDFAPAVKPAPAPAEPETGAAPPPVRRKKDPRRLWTEFLASLRDRKPLLYLSLRDARMEIIGETLRLSGDGASSTLERMLDAGDRAFIEQEFSRLASKSLRLDIAAEGAATPEATSPPPPDAVMESSPAPEDMAPNSPLVDKIVELFHGEIIEQKGE